MNIHSFPTPRTLSGPQVRRSPRSRSHSPRLTTSPVRPTSPRSPPTFMEMQRREEDAIRKQQAAVRRAELKENAKAKKDAVSNSKMLRIFISRIISSMIIFYSNIIPAGARPAQCGTGACNAISKGVGHKQSGEEPTSKDEYNQSKNFYYHPPPPFSSRPRKRRRRQSGRSKATARSGTPSVAGRSTVRSRNRTRLVKRH